MYVRATIKDTPSGFRLLGEISAGAFTIFA